MKARHLVELPVKKFTYTDSFFRELLDASELASERSHQAVGYPPDFGKLMIDRISVSVFAATNSGMCLPGAFPSDQPVFTKQPKDKGFNLCGVLAGKRM